MAKKRPKESKVFLFENMATGEETETVAYDLKTARVQLPAGEWLLIRSATQAGAGVGLSLKLHRKRHIPM
jgi:hypothetical protein